MYKVSLIIPVYNGEEFVETALQSIPKRKDIEIIIIDDGSTDRTAEIAREYCKGKENAKIITIPVNKGLGNAKNVGYDNAKGEYINQLDSDDFLYTEEYEKAMSELDGTDIVFMDLKRNDGSILKFMEQTYKDMGSGCARFIRREFLGGTRCRDRRWAEDWFLSYDLEQKNPTHKFTGIVGYHYNYPRAGSLCDQAIHGLYEIPR